MNPLPLTSPIQTYLNKLEELYQTGKATEHSYRPCLQILIEELHPSIKATNEPKRIRCGAPDYIVQRNGIDLGYIEVKDVDVDLDKIEATEQMARYLAGLDNFILSNYTEFRFFVRREKIASVSIGEWRGTKLIKQPANYQRFLDLLSEFMARESLIIKTSDDLATALATKARLMKDSIYQTIIGPDVSSLRGQLESFREILIHDMNEEQFADVYAQTLVYGIFTARIQDISDKEFNRQIALNLIPKTNPFLRQLFGYVAGNEIDETVVWIIESVCQTFHYTDLVSIMADFGRITGGNDPVLHFYESFLADYDPNLRKIRGVYYTPEPVVAFMMRAVDELLVTEFGLPQGLADASKVPTEQGEEVHKVQLLDVAAGSGSFMAAAIKQIYRKFVGQEGLWSSYVDDDLLPRLHGFEILMAPYAICHMKLGLLLKETGYQPRSPNKPKRLGVYLTNSLEEAHPPYHLGFSQWLSDEANKASELKRDMPIMVAFGNPPYLGESVNKGDWIMGLLKSYKVEPNSKAPLQEKNPKWLNDDYVKFIRLGEYFIKKNSEGILAYITNHAYLDNPTFRGMRWHLLNTFDDIYIIDLHGNSLKKEKTPDGKKDMNVFDIKVGVAIIIAVKRKNNKAKTQLANLYHKDLWGERYDKYEQLDALTLKNIPLAKPPNFEPYYFFIQKDNQYWYEYKQGFSLQKLFPSNSVGITTARDSLTIHESKEKLERVIQDFAYLSHDKAREKFKLGKDTRDWKVELAQNDLKSVALNKQFLRRITYRPFDIRWTYYTGKTKGFLCMPRREIMQHMVRGDNIALVVGRQGQVVGNMPWNLIAVVKNVVDLNLFYRGGGTIYPLYLFEALDGTEVKRPNLDKTIYNKIQSIIPDLTPESLFDYIYAILHAPSYRLRYAEFLKFDFPQIPYPKSVDYFKDMAKLGGELRALHLLESLKLQTPITSFPIAGNHEVLDPRYEAAKGQTWGKVWLNHSQYFDKVPEVAWEFYVGGYQPAQKWLKDRKGEMLTTEQIRHYQQIITALSETYRLMGVIDQLFIG